MSGRSAKLDKIFRALGSEPRREILRQVAAERRTVTELADLFSMSLAAVSKHVHVLADAGLISQTREGRVAWCRLKPESLAPAQAAIDEVRSFWARQLDSLESFLK
jgi:DNA-binding transcriptional ArsR family regulator